MLPPGRARLATSPAPTGSPTTAMTMGIVVVACLAASDRRIRPRHDDVDLEPDQLGRESGEPLVLSLRPSVLDHDVLALDVAELAQPSPERLDEMLGRHGRGRGHEEADPIDLPRLLRLGGERRGEEAASQRRR